MNGLVSIFRVAGHTVTIDAGAVYFDLPSWRKTYHRVVDPFIGLLRKRRSGEVRAKGRKRKVFMLCDDYGTHNYTVCLLSMTLSRTKRGVDMSWSCRISGYADATKPSNRSVSIFDFPTPR